MFSVSFQGLLAALDGTELLDHKVALSCGRKDHADGGLGFSGHDGFKSPTRYEVGPRSPFAMTALGKNDPLRLDDFFEDVFVGIIRPIGSVHHLFPSATDAKI